MQDLNETRQRLEKEDANFRRLLRKHREFEDRLEELNSHIYLSPDEQYEAAKLKKMKLALKDQMEILIRQSSGGSAH